MPATPPDPVLERYGAHPTIFICTGIVGTPRRYWWTLDELGAKERDGLRWSCP